jgi:hypothetical protein
VDGQWFSGGDVELGLSSTNTKLSIERKCRETVCTHSFIVMSASFWIVSPLNHWEMSASSGSGATPYPCCPEIV